MRIAIITGGETGEREISIQSAKHIERSIDFGETRTFVFPEEKEKFFDSCKNFDIVFPVIHGVGGEDGLLQRSLDELHMPYIFSDPKAHFVCINKKSTKEVVESLGIKTPKETKDFPLFAKPNLGGSSVASRICNSDNDLENLVSLYPNIEFIFEELIYGREFTVGVIEHSGKTISLPIIEIIPKGKFFDFESKYDTENLALEICPADIDSDLAKRLQAAALKIHTNIGIRHISRSDFMVTSDGEIYFLETNTIPGMTETSLIPKMLKQAGIHLPHLLREWVLAIIPSWENLL